MRPIAPRARALFVAAFEVVQPNGLVIIGRPLPERCSQNAFRHAPMLRQSKAGRASSGPALPQAPFAYEASTLTCNFKSIAGISAGPMDAHRIARALWWT